MKKLVLILEHQKFKVIQFKNCDEEFDCFTLVYWIISKEDKWEILYVGQIIMERSPNKFTEKAHQIMLKLPPNKSHQIM